MKLLGIKLRSEKQKLLREKPIFFSKLFFIKVLLKDEENKENKLIISIPKKKIKLSVKRNKIRRRIRESLRISKINLEKNFLIFIKINNDKFENFSWKEISYHTNNFLKILSKKIKSHNF